MPITELVLPNFKNDPVSVQELETAFPAAFSVFHGAAGLYSLRLGYQVSHRSTGLSAAKRQPLTICEWNSVDSFKSFSNTPSFDIFQQRIGAYKVAPPSLELYNTPGTSSNNATTAPLTQILRLNSTVPASWAAEKKLQELVADESSAAVGFYSGQGIWRPDTQLILVGWQSIEDFQGKFLGSEAAEAVDQAVRDSYSVHFLAALESLVEQPQGTTASAEPVKVQAILPTESGIMVTAPTVGACASYSN